MTTIKDPYYNEEVTVIDTQYSANYDNASDYTYQIFVYSTKQPCEFKVTGKTKEQHNIMKDHVINLNEYLNDQKNVINVPHYFTFLFDFFFNLVVKLEEDLKATPTNPETKAKIKNLEADNQAQAKKIQELETKQVDITLYVLKSTAAAEKEAAKQSIREEIEETTSKEIENLKAQLAEANTKIAKLESTAFDANLHILKSTAAAEKEAIQQSVRNEVEATTSKDIENLKAQLVEANTEISELKSTAAAEKEALKQSILKEEQEAASKAIASLNSQLTQANTEISELKTNAFNPDIHLLKEDANKELDASVKAIQEQLDNTVQEFNAYKIENADAIIFFKFMLKDYIIKKKNEELASPVEANSISSDNEEE